MIEATSLYSYARGAGGRRIALAMFAVWLIAVGFLAWTHLVWRDEVRALSLSLEGNTVFAMLRGVHGEGHPAIWYLLLRAAHALAPRPEVLLVVSVLIAAVAMLIVVLRAPFSLPFLALILLARFSVYEYSVMARNYGLTMLLLFVFAIVYDRYRDKNLLPGMLLFLLANCNVPSILIVGGLMLFWLVDILYSDPVARSRRFRMFFGSAALAALGVVTCFLTISPLFNDAAVIRHESIGPGTVIKGIFLPSLQFLDSCRIPGLDKLMTVIPLFVIPLTIFKSMVLLGSTLGLIRRTGVFLAGLATLLGFSLYFVMVYPGGYRHQALWLVFMICMYWLAAPVSGGNEPAYPAWLAPSAKRLANAGTWLFVLVLLMQVPYSFGKLAEITTAPAMALANRSHNAGEIFALRPDLSNSVVIADPDYLLETLPYYVANPTYLMREQRYGNVVHFTRNARLELSLGDVLANARRLRTETGRPVVILLSRKIDASLSPAEYSEGYDWKFTTTPEQAKDFQLSTSFIAHHVAPPEIDEDYDAYVLNK